MLIMGGKTEVEVGEQAGGVEVSSENMSSSLPSQEKRQKRFLLKLRVLVGPEDIWGITANIFT